MSGIIELILRSIKVITCLKLRKSFLAYAKICDDFFILRFLNKKSLAKSVLSTGKIERALSLMKELRAEVAISEGTVVRKKLKNS